MITAEQVQAKVRQAGEFYAIGKSGRNVCVGVDEYPSGKIVAGADYDKITAAQIGAALERIYPGRYFYTLKECGYLYATSKGQE